LGGVPVVGHGQEENPSLFGDRAGGGDGRVE